MADLSDVEKAVVAQIASALFPTPYLSGSYAGSNAGVVVKLYRGWPESANLDADLAAGYAHIAVWSDPQMARPMSRYQLEWFTPIPAAPTLTANAAGAVVTFGGTGGAGQVAGVSWGKPPSTSTYRLGANDTPATVAAALAATIAGASASGNTLTLPTSLYVTALVGADSVSYRELRRQAQGMRVCCFCPTAGIRDALCGLIDANFVAMTDAFGNPTEFIALPTGEEFRWTYRGTSSNDMPTKDKLWRRDLMYLAEYGSCQSQTQPAMLFGLANLTANAIASPTV